MDQQQNFSDAILHKKARIAALKQSLANIPSWESANRAKVTSGSVQRTHEEILHLEQAVTELEAENNRLQKSGNQSRPDKELEFRNSGGVWHFAYPGDNSDSIKGEIGFVYIRELLRQPFVGLPAESLGAITLERARTCLKPNAVPELSISSTGNDAIAGGNDDTVATYQAQARKLQEELQEPLLSESRRIEIVSALEYIGDELKLLQFKGRAKVPKSTSRRATDRVNKGVSRALDSLSTKFPNLTQHLRASLATGSILAYRPSVQREWVI